MSRKTAITSPECTGCLDCVAACPVEDALGVGLPRRRRLAVPAYAGAILALFFAGYLGARAAGAWHNGISDAEYVQRVGHDAVELYAHPGLDGSVPAEPASVRQSPAPPPQCPASVGAPGSAGMVKSH